MKVRKEYRTIEDVRNLALDTLSRLEVGEIDLETADAKANMIGKAIASVKAQLAYHLLRKERPEIPFMNCSNVIALEQPAPATEKKRPALRKAS